MIEDKRIFKAISQIKVRSERFEEATEYQRTFVDLGILDELENENHQILYGRRGTGKTHVFKVLEKQLQGEKSNIVAYLDCRNLGSTDQVGLEGGAGSEVMSQSISRYVDLTIDWLLLDFIVDKADDQADACMKAADELLAAISSPIEQLYLKQRDEEEHYGRVRDTVGDAELASGGFKVRLSSTAKRESKVGIKSEYTAVIDDSIYFVRISSNLSEILERNKAKLYVFVDEWSSINPDLQPMLADLIRRTLCVCKRVTVKIAAIEARTTFNSWTGSYRIGLEIGSDIFSAPHLDDYYMYDQDEGKLVGLYLEIIYNHLRNNLPSDYLRKRYSINDHHTLAEKMLTEKALSELARAAEGVIRDLLNIFILALSKAVKSAPEMTGKIEAIHVVEAANQWFERDKLQSIPPATARALAVLERELVGERKTRFFAIPGDCIRTPLLNSLLDSRLVHSVWKNMTHPRKPGIRLNVYCLDYGSCLSVVRGNDRYRQKVKYSDIMEAIAIKLEQVSDFDPITTVDFFGADAIATSPSSTS